MLRIFQGTESTVHKRARTMEELDVERGVRKPQVLIPIQCYAEILHVNKIDRSWFPRMPPHYMPGLPRWLTLCKTISVKHSGEHSRRVKICNPA